MEEEVYRGWKKKRLDGCVIRCGYVYQWKIIPCYDRLYKLE